MNRVVITDPVTGLEVLPENTSGVLRVSIVATNNKVTDGEVVEFDWDFRSDNVLDLSKIYLSCQTTTPGQGYTQFEIEGGGIEPDSKDLYVYTACSSNICALDNTPSGQFKIDFSKCQDGGTSFSSCDTTGETIGNLTCLQTSLAPSCAYKVSGMSYSIVKEFTPDEDGDGYSDEEDNCPLAYNPSQSDNDNDGLGDVCEHDDDNDTIEDAFDNCPFIANLDQLNVDGDDYGDVCDLCANDADNDADGDGFCADVDNCPIAYNPEQTDANNNGMGDACEAASGMANIKATVTSNDVLANGTPGQQYLAGTVVKAFDKADSCVSTYFPDALGVSTNCATEYTCTTDASGKCEIMAPVSNYFALVESMAYPGKYASHSVDDLYADEIRNARFAFLKTPNGKVSPGKSSKRKGSVLWMHEPEHVVWSGEEEYYPFVFESDSAWAVDVCVEAPEGYVPMDGVNCLQTVVANEAKAILFKIIEVGSVPGKVKVDMKLKGPKGKFYHYRSEVNMRLSKKLAEEKGVKIDNHGRLTKEKSGQKSFVPSQEVLKDSGLESEADTLDRVLNWLKGLLK